jgi:hypothetical protein
MDIRVLLFRVNDLCYVRYKSLDSTTTILCFAMAKPLATELTRESTQFFEVDSEVDTNDTIFFDAPDTISGNAEMSQPDSEMTGNGDNEDGSTESHPLEAPQSDDRMGDNGSEHTHRAQTPYFDDNTDIPDFDDNMDTPQMRVYRDLDNMDPWADRVENMTPMDKTDGGDSELEIDEELKGPKRMRALPFLFDNAEGSQAQSTKRLNVGFQKYIWFLPI